ncbi:hypothetical protein [Buttiauxella gaviniae]|uniref:hypothetical protein n=1 Tax=Buttiauxella gaviniae TaxID=82990 RepID=UPI0039752C48
MIWDKNLSAEQSHSFALKWVSDAFIILQTATHRRPVYRHRYGDIALTFISLSRWLDSQLEATGKTMGQRGAQFVDFIDWDKWEHEKNNQQGYLYSMGAIPSLTMNGIAWINCQLNQLGDMLQGLGPEAAKKLLNMEDSQ